MIKRPRPFNRYFGLSRQQALHLVKTATVGYFGLHTLCRDIPPCMSIGGCVHAHRGMCAFRTYTGVCPYGERMSIGGCVHVHRGLRAFRTYTGVCPYGERMSIGGCVHVHRGMCAFRTYTGVCPYGERNKFSCVKKKKLQHFSTFCSLKFDIQENKRVLEGCSKGAKVLQEAVLSQKTYFFLSFLGKNCEKTCTNGILFVTLYRQKKINNLNRLKDYPL